jgi:hypothetical protein
MTKKKLTLARETLRTIGARELEGVAGGTSQWTVVVGSCVKPQPTYKCTLYPCFTDLLTQRCPTG